MAEREHQRALDADAETSARTSSWYEADTRRRWVQAKGYEPKRRQLDLMVALRRFIDITAPNEPDGILRPVRQLLAGPGRYMGWKSTGSAALDHQRFSNRFKRGFDYLAVIGVVSERRYVLQPNGEGVGILVRPGPCSSTGAATPLRGRHSARRRPPCQTSPRPSRTAQRRLIELRPLRDHVRNCLPPFGSTHTDFVGMRAVEGLRPRAHAREASPEPDSAAAARAARRGLAAAALKSWWTERPSGEASGGELLSAVPELLELDQLDVVRLVAELALPTASPVISPRQRRRLIASIRRADRCADFGAGRAGAGLELALDIVLGDWQDIWVRGRGRSRPPLSLGAIAVCMHRESRRWRRGDRARRAARSC